MIPEIIRIDDNWDFEIQMPRYNCKDRWPIKFTFEQIEKAYFLAKSKRE